MATVMADKKSKTKIVCTIGPASEFVPMIEKLLRTCMNVAHFNFSHGSYDYHQETLDNLRTSMDNTGILCAVMPVLSKSSGLLFEKRLIERHVQGSINFSSKCTGSRHTMGIRVPMIE